MFSRSLILLLALLFPSWSVAQSPTPGELRDSAQRALDIIQRSSAEYLKQRECFSCHHQSMSILTLIDARKRGLAVDLDNLTRQVDRTVEHLKRGQAEYSQGKGQGGGVDTAGYALTGLAVADVPGSEVTSAVVEYLLQIHQDDQHWKCSSNRPPTESSDITTTAVALTGLLKYAPASEHLRAAQRSEAATQWLLNQTANDTEQRVFKLFALDRVRHACQPANEGSLKLNVDVQAIDGAIKQLQTDLLGTQQPDGSWKQTTEDATGDAYATATAMVALAVCGLPTDSAPYIQGLQYLRGQQQADGSWHVITRSKPIQKYFESGFPHGVDQFISMSATCWASLALQQALPLANDVERFMPTATDHPETVAKEATAQETEFFEREIRPLLVENCMSCHGPEEQSGNLRVDSLAALLAGGESGPAIVPGAPERSLMMRAVHRQSELKMPPEAPLAAVKVAKLDEWIKLGAPWPKAASPEQFDRRRNAGKTHWAFQQPQYAALPDVAQTSWPTGVVDQFVLANLEQHQLTPHQTAERRDLLRRLSYDLIGLPPSFEDVQEFVLDQRPDAVQRVIDRLLASPMFGQQWGRHWLDVARYSDTKGYVYGREERFFVHAAPYRDWVVSALANDLPYDQFVKLQLAADQLAADDPAAQAAMGFLTVGRRFLGVTHDIIDDRIDVVSRGLLGLTVGCARCHDHKFDPIPTADYYSLYGVFLNSIERRVRIEAAANSTASEASKTFEEQYAALQQKYVDQLAAEKKAAYEEVIKRLPDYLRAQLELEKHPAEGFDVIIQKDDLVPAQIRRFQAWLIDSGYRQEPIFAAWRMFQELPSDKFASQAEDVTNKLKGLSAAQLNPFVARQFATTPASMQEVVERYGQLLTKLDSLQGENDADRQALAELKAFIEAPNSPCRVPDEDIVSTEQFYQSRVTEALWKLQGDVERLIINTPSAPAFATHLVDRAFIREPHVFRRGNPLHIAQRVPRQFVGILCADPNEPGSGQTLGQSTGTSGVRLVNTDTDKAGGTPRAIERQPFVHGSGRRELAEAIVDPRNPLTARVWVNRIWQHLFGQGMVTTPSDFGLRATPPSHPELLDRLALELIASQYSTKHIVRQIVSSSAYQQASKAVSGDDAVRFKVAADSDPDNRWLWRGNDKRLSLEQLRDTWLCVASQLDHTVGGKAKPLFGDGLNRRRTIYGLVDRQFLPGVLRVFDFANPDLHTPQRSETTVPQQALFVLNHEFTATIARELEKQLSVANTDKAEQVKQLFQRVLDRMPTDSELADCFAFLDQPPEIVPEIPPENRDWRYGFGKLNEADGRVEGFTALPYFNGSAWQGGPKWPDEQLGWVQVTATGGHAGNDLDHASVRRWVAPMAGTISIQSNVIHNVPAGDGIRAAIVHTTGETARVLLNEVVHNREQVANVNSLVVAAGDTVDFVVNFNGNLNNDQFLWSPVITSDTRQWHAEKNFGGKEPTYLNPWQQLAQVLLLSNELAFVD